jgi:hypothetical protein
MWWLRPYGILFYLFTPLFQLIAVVAPFLYLFTPYWYIVLAIAISPFLWNRKIIGIFKSRYVSKLKATVLTEITPRKIIVVVKTYGYYFYHIIFPRRVLFHYTQGQEFGITKSGTDKVYSINGDFWLGISSILISFYLFCLPQTRFYIFWSALFIVPYCNFFSIVQFVADRYTSISIVGMTMVIATVVIQCPLLAGFLLGYYTLYNIKVQNMYKDIDNFYWYHIYNYPESMLNILFYCKNCIDARMFSHAFVAIKRALYVKPTDFRLLMMYSKILKITGLRNEADRNTELAEEQVDDTIYLSKKELRDIIMELYK